MRWSKLKQLVEDRMADSLQRRVEVYYTRYRTMKDEYGRGWITLDKSEIVRMSDHDFINQRDEAERQIEKGSIAFDGQYVDVTYGYAAPRGTSFVHQQGIYGGWEFTRSLWKSLSLSIEDALYSENVIIRAFAMLDSRLGKRRLRALHLGDDEHPLVRQFYDLRCEAEGIKVHAA
jgi:hypothetical protein